MVPLLTGITVEAEQLRGNIGLLHNRLENYQLHAGKGDIRERITFTNIFLCNNIVVRQSMQYFGMTYEIVPSSSKLLCRITRRNGTQAFLLNQDKYDLAELEANGDFLANLNPTQRGHMLSIYRLVCPRNIVNLTDGNQPSIECGAYQFPSTAEELFAGVVEVIYLMRCTFFHGELVPSREASACYEPTYHLVRRFLQAIS